MIAISAVLILALLAVTLWQGSHHPISASPDLVVSQSEPVVNEPIQPIPLQIDLDPKRVALGEKLFNETQLSHDNTISCATCHQLSSGGVDHLQHATGINGIVGTINTPTVYNSGFNFRQFWNGRAASLEDQVHFPVENSAEMASTLDEATAKLNALADYVTSFNAIYPDGITPTNIADSIATFERSLTTPNSPFDQYLRGDNNALTLRQRQGYQLFKSYGCVSCHQGVNVGGNMYQKMGIVANYFDKRGMPETNADLGLNAITGLTADLHVFKVPSLRLVALTPPYLHDGTVATLDDAVKVMAFYQLGRSISDDQVALITEFLKSLVGQNADLKPTS